MTCVLGAGSGLVDISGGRGKRCRKAVFPRAAMAPPDPKKKKKKKDRPSALTLFFCGEPPDEVALGEAIDCGLSSGERVRLYSWQDGTGFRAKKLVALEERSIGSQVELREAPHQQTLAEVMEVLFGDVVNAEKERRLRRTKEEEQNENHHLLSR